MVCILFLPFEMLVSFLPLRSSSFIIAGSVVSWISLNFYQVPFWMFCIGISAADDPLSACCKIDELTSVAYSYFYKLLTNFGIEITDIILCVIGNRVLDMHPDCVCAYDTGVVKTPSLNGIHPITQSLSFPRITRTTPYISVSSCLRSKCLLSFSCLIHRFHCIVLPVTMLYPLLREPHYPLIQPFTLGLKQEKRVFLMYMNIPLTIPIS